MHSTSSPKHPPLLRLRSSNRFILTTVCLAVFTDGFLYGVVIPVFPFSLSERSGIPEYQIQRWSSYLLTSFGGAALLTSPFAGWLADNGASRRVTFMGGLVLQAMATSLFAISSSVYVLLVARALQGFSSAVVYSVGLAMLVDTVGVDRIGEQAGYFITTANFGVIIAPILGGFIYGHAGYYAVVLMMMTLIGVDILLRVIMIEKQVAKTWIHGPGDIEQPLIHDEANYGTILPVEPQEVGVTNAGADCNVFATKSNDVAINSSSIISESELSSPPNSQSSTRSYQLPTFLYLLLSPRAFCCSWVVFVGLTLITSFDACLTVFVKHHFGWSSSDAGFLFIVFAIPSLVSPVAGRYCAIYGPKWLVIGGFLVASTGIFSMAFIDKPTTLEVVALCILLIVISSGLAVVLPCVADDLTAFTDRLCQQDSRLRGKTGAFAQAFALFNCGIAAGTVTGPLLVSILIPWLGWKLTMWVLCIVALVPTAPVAWLLPCKGGYSESEGEST